MRDTEQPGLEGATVIEFVQLAISLEQRLLHNVFAVHHGTRHAGAVTMQVRTKRGDGLKEGPVARFERSRDIVIPIRVHHRPLLALLLTLREHPL
jgi:hypothetical protein